MDVILVDDHQLIRDAMSAVVKEAEPTAHVREAATFRQAAEHLESYPGIHLAIIDVALPDGSGLELLELIRARFPLTAVAVLSASSDRQIMADALDRGAIGFIPKSSSRAVMLGALRLILAGGKYIPAELWPVRALPAQAESRLPPTPQALGLTDRQLEVLSMVIEGKSNKAIARQLSIAEVTVKHHVSALMRALRVQNRTEAVVAVAKLGWKLADSS